MADTDSKESYIKRRTVKVDDARTGAPRRTASRQRQRRCASNKPPAAGRRSALGGLSCLSPGNGPPARISGGAMVFRSHAGLPLLPVIRRRVGEETNQERAEGAFSKGARRPFLLFKSDAREADKTRGRRKRSRSRDQGRALAISATISRPTSRPAVGKKKGSDRCDRVDSEQGLRGSPVQKTAW